VTRERLDCWKEKSSDKTKWGVVGLPELIKKRKVSEKSFANLLMKGVDHWSELVTQGG